MTKETKIGLLVGLMFIILIGILLSDNFRGTMEPPSAPLDKAGSTVRQAVAAPGTGNAPPVVYVPAPDVSPRGTVATQRDLDAPPPPVVVTATGNQTGATGHPATPAAPGSNAGDSQGPVAGIIPADLADAAHRHGEDLVAVNPNGTTTPDPIGAAGTGNPTGTPQTQLAAANGTREHVAVAGDSVSKMAAKFLGQNTKANRDAIIKLNPSLQTDANKVVVGHTYLIPAAPAGAAPAGPTTPQVATVAPPTPTTPSNRPEIFYTVKPNDSLWKIANNVLGDPSAVAAIQDLNHDVLNGSTTVQVGMKLRLPARPVASAN
jgi:nucleoid-associated protein YgaU